MGFADVPPIGKFQFHKGTIKAMSVKRPFNLVTLFQFHKGTIKAFFTL